MNWLKAFRIALITDSVVFVLKIFLPLYTFYAGVKVKQNYDNSVKTDSSSLTPLVIVLIFIGTAILLIFILLRLMTNYYQYRNERQGYHRRNYAKVFCWSFCWFTVCFVNIGFVVLLIWIDWTYGKWLRKVAIGFLCWEIVILCFMAIFKWSVSEATYSNVVQNEKNKPKGEINVK